MATTFVEYTEVGKLLNGFFYSVKSDVKVRVDGDLKTSGTTTTLLATLLQNWW